MIINNEYFLRRINVLLAEKRLAKAVAGGRKRLPRWILRLNPVYLIWKLYRSSAAGRRKRLEWALSPSTYSRDPFYVSWKLVHDSRPVDISGFQHHPFAVGFVDYCTGRDVNFDTALYYPGQDHEIERFLDNRLECALFGNPRFPEIHAALEPDLMAFRAGIRIKKRDGNQIFHVPGRDARTEGDEKRPSVFLLPGVFDIDPFYYRYGLRMMPESMARYIADKDFIDAGAYIGDSAIALLEYDPRRIYAFEPEDVNCRALRHTIVMNGAEDRIQVVPTGLGDKSSSVNINSDAACSMIAAQDDSATADSDALQQIDITTIDLASAGLNVGLIKIDVEGFEYNIVKGAEQTIRRDRPVLLISVYHTAKDFFEIPPMIRSFCPDYKFRFVDTSPNNPLFEKMAVAYPGEIG